MVELIIVTCEQGTERHCAADLLRVASGGAEIRRDERGKPYFPDNPALHFNVSHCDGYAAVAFSDSPVGVDIELLSRFERLKNPQRFAERIFPAFESADVEPLTLLSTWTKLESFLKLRGTGFRTNLAQIDFGTAWFKQIYFDGIAMCHIAVAAKNESINGQYS